MRTFDDAVTSLTTAGELAATLQGVPPTAILGALVGLGAVVAFAWCAVMGLGKRAGGLR